MPFANLNGLRLSETICTLKRGSCDWRSFNWRHSTQILARISMGPTAPIEFSVFNRGMAMVFITGWNDGLLPARSDSSNCKRARWPIWPGICLARPCLTYEHHCRIIAALLVAREEKCPGPKLCAANKSMNHGDKTILVSGATGRQGGALLKHLRKNQWRVRALTRNPRSPVAAELARS